MKTNAMNPEGLWFGRPAPERDEDGRLTCSPAIRDWLIDMLFEAFCYETAPVTPADVADMWDANVEASELTDEEKRACYGIDDETARDLADEINARTGFDADAA